MQVDQGEHFLMSKEETVNKIATLTGGRAAEELIFNSITLVRQMILNKLLKWQEAIMARFSGMSDSFDMMGLETVSNAYLINYSLLLF